MNYDDVNRTCIPGFDNPINIIDIDPDTITDVEDEVYIDTHFSVYKPIDVYLDIPLYKRSVELADIIIDYWVQTYGFGANLDPSKELKIIYNRFAHDLPTKFVRCMLDWADAVYRNYYYTAHIEWRSSLYRPSDYLMLVKYNPNGKVLSIAQAPPLTNLEPNEISSLEFSLAMDNLDLLACMTYHGSLFYRYTTRAFNATDAGIVEDEYSRVSCNGTELIISYDGSRIAYTTARLVRYSMYKHTNLYADYVNLL